MTKAAELAKMGEVLTNSQIGGRRNMIINGACQVAQRGTSSTGLGGSAPGYTTVDRWQMSVGATSAGRFSTAQVAVTDLPGFANAFHLDCTTADTSIAAGEVLKIDYKIEGQDLQQLKKGTSDAEKVTVSFYMKTNKAFTFMCELDDRDNNRVNTQQFTTTTSWTRHVLTFAGDTTGTLNDDNALSIAVTFFLHAGSDFTGGTYSANTWQSRQSSDNMRAVGIGSFFDSTDNDIKITGLQMEVGSQATPFEHRSFGEELALCQRYYYRTPRYINSGIGANESIATGNMDGSTVGAFLIRFPQLMRDAPTAFEQSGTASHYSVRVTSDANGTSVPTSGDFMSDSAFVNLTASGAGFTSGDGAFLRVENTSAFLAWSAEL